MTNRNRDNATPDSGRVRCAICGFRTRNIARHTAEAHPSDEPTIQQREDVVDELESALTPDATSGVEPIGAEIVEAIAAPSAAETFARIDAALTIPETAPAVVTPTPPRGSIMDRAVCLAVSKGRFGNTRRASTALVSVNAEKSMLALSKRLLQSPELVMVRRLDNEVWAYLNTVALPSMFKSGVYLVPIPMIQTIEDDMRAFAERRRGLVADFLAAYPAQVLAVKEELRDLYDPRDYPSVSAMAALFHFDWQYVTFGVPGTLREINAALFQAESEKAAAKVQEAADECRQVMRAALLDLIEKMRDRLTPSEDGTRKIFRDSLIENMNDFLKTFEMRDITDDAELGSLVGRIRGVMSGVDAKTLRSDEALRDAIAGQMNAIGDTLGALVVTRTRAISFDDEVGA